MAFDKALADRIQCRIQHLNNLTVKKMFGGIGYLINGNMAVGVYKDALIVRVGPEKYKKLLAEPFAGEFDITGRAMTGWIMVEPNGVQSDETLHFWLDHGIDFASNLPPK